MQKKSLAKAEAYMDNLDSGVFTGTQLLTKISIIAPTYNEIESLPVLVDRIHNCLAGIDYELVVVDDNSPDGTGELAEELALTNPIKVVHRRGKLGLASAVIEGFQQASGDIIGVIDADLQHPPENILDLLDGMGEADIVVACRYMDGGGVEGWTFTREYISRGAKIIPHFLFAKIRYVKDPLSGFFLFRKKVIEGVDLNPIGFKILLEILIRGNHNSVAEVPYVFVGRELGTSTLNSTEQINYLKHLWRLTLSEKEPERFIKYCLVGGTGVLVNEGIYWMLTRWGNMVDVAAVIISIEISIITNFFLNDFWTFRDRREEGTIINRAFKFNSICGAAAVMNFGIFFFLTRVFHMFDMLALLIAIGIAMVFNFVFNKLLTWR